ncbi:amidophosphoribosyltransferase [Candidatus Peribacteria bacterium RIFCSPHIGHO2_02_FULL_49_16]|nr:MAG: amidophosphoribosyltransferase [Candidatus Peribacteria bacterium RIFCSPHIGHO2_01_FULL_49_38]OGJ59205.1 MAG: amidophosphoribosyltransferase [Candidatus Peribacteria bacterium RIFCSPHIGHO2_02_FULL_49_16]
MCGVLGIIGTKDVIQDLYDGLTMLQHRGQDAAGIVTYDRQFHMKKANGMVRDVFHLQSLLRLRGHRGIGHVRYPTAGGSSEFEVQPFFVNAPLGIAMVHNGNLTNAPELSHQLLHTHFRHLNTTSDSEVLLNVFAIALEKQKPVEFLPEHVFRAMRSVFRKCKGSYSVVALIGHHGMVAFRDPHGIRPLQIGAREREGKMEYIVCSENTVMKPLGFRFLRDIQPGEVIFIDGNNFLHTKQCASGLLTPCVFEWVYLAAPDSLLDDVSVYKARVRMGEALALQIRRAKLKIDSIIPIPDSSRAAAAGLADKLGIRYREGFVKNRYIGRTFIMPSQRMRKQSIQFKLQTIDLEFLGNNVLIVDDSIVRGNTSTRIVEMARQAGAKKVYFASASPPITRPCPYGVDIPTYEELIASKQSIEEICKTIGADALFYVSIEDMVHAVQRGSTRVRRMCTGCFNGRYASQEVTEEMLHNLGLTRIGGTESVVQPVS